MMTGCIDERVGQYGLDCERERQWEVVLLLLSARDDRMLRSVGFEEEEATSFSSLGRCSILFCTRSSFSGIGLVEG
eukprot:502463-Rhodomonas_salina.1